MKKSLLLLLLTILVLANYAFASPIKVYEAKKLAVTFLKGKGISTSDLSVDSISESKTNYIYIFNVANEGGFVLVGADDRLKPILGYGDKSNFQLDRKLTNIYKWIEFYKEEIRYALKNVKEADAETKIQWQNLRSDYNPNSSARVASVLPLIQTTWDQSPYYNALCPYDNQNSERTVVGCVATALAQVMKFWNYPLRGTGSNAYNHPRYGTLSANFANTTYNWSDMPNYINSPNSAIATLSYHCGVAVNMDYNVGSQGGSSAYTITNGGATPICTENALKNYFGYSTSLIGVERINYSSTAWASLARTELDAGRPILYSGHGSGGGHAFVCDGYDDNGLYHFNWGWAGSSDGYFLLNALNPGSLGTGGGTGGFNSGQDMIIGIQPPASSLRYNMVLNADVLLSTSNITPGTGFTVTTNVSNRGTSDFSGDYAAAVFQNNTFIDFVSIISSRTLPAGYTYTNPLEFTTAGITNMRSGNYDIYIYFRPTGGIWQSVENTPSYTNSATITVASPSATLELYAPITVVGGNEVVQNSAISATFNVVNRGTSTFYGAIDLDVYSTSGAYIRTIQSYPTCTLEVNTRYFNNLTYTMSSFDVAAGTYLLTASYRPNGGSWTNVDASSYMNPIIITVVEAPINPDQYEPNNTLAQASNIALGGGSNQSCNTFGSNFHIGNDVEYYKITLPRGYGYTINARLQDSYSSNNSQIYTVDALFSYSLDNGITYSNAYDDVMEGPITTNGGTIIFKVAPFFQGNTGSYLLDIPIVTGPTDVSSRLELSNVKLSPNPAQNNISINAPLLKNGLISILNTKGQELASFNQENTNQDINISQLANGVYIIRLSGNDGVANLRFVKE